MYVEVVLLRANNQDVHLDVWPHIVFKLYQ